MECWNDGSRGRKELNSLRSQSKSNKRNNRMNHMDQLNPSGEITGYGLKEWEKFREVIHKISKALTISRRERTHGQRGNNDREVNAIKVF
jgi:hypothetical protein